MIVYRIGAFEEEDFHGSMYNFYLAIDVPDTKAHLLLKQVPLPLRIGLRNQLPVSIRWLIHLFVRRCVRQQCEAELQKRAKQVARQVAEKADPKSPEVSSDGDRPKDMHDSEEHHASSDSSDKIEDSLESILALHLRLRFVRHLFQGLCALESRPGMTAGFTEARTALQLAAGALKSIREAVEAAPNENDSDSFPTAPGFDAVINQR